MDKLPLLNQILQQNPADAFARYGLAMEYVAQGHLDQALAEFDTLIQHNADYVPGYQMSAQTLLKAGRTADAAARLQAGVGIAQRSGNTHAQAEMQALLEEIA